MSCQPSGACVHNQGVDSGKVAAKKRPDGMPVGKPFQPGVSGNPEGRPPGIPNLEARVRALLDGEAQLPEPIANVIRAQCGEDKKAIDAVFIAVRPGRSSSWSVAGGRCRISWEGGDAPIQHTFTRKIDNG